MPITAADADCSVPYVCVFKCLHRQSILPIYLTIRDPCWGLAPPPLSYLLTSFRSDNDAFTSRMHDLSLIPAFKWMYFATFDCSIWVFPILSWTELNWTELIAAGISRRQITGKDWFTASDTCHFMLVEDWEENEVESAGEDRNWKGINPHSSPSILSNIMISYFSTTNA